jgi:hypothetical protein
VHWTSYGAVLDIPVAEWSLLMGTHIVKAVDSIGDLDEEQRCR